MIYDEYSKNEIVNASSKSSSIKEFLDILGIPINKGGYRKAHILASFYGVQLTSSQGYTQSLKSSNVRYSNEEFFINGAYRGGVKIRKRLLELGWEYKCSILDCPTNSLQNWLGKKIVFQVDHISGDNLDNRLENLRFLCPICHSLTETYGSKNCNSKRVTKKKKSKCYCECGQERNVGAISCIECYKTKYKTKKIKWPTTEEIISNIHKYGYLPYSKILGVSDNAIRKHLRGLGINPLPRKKI